MSDVNRMKLQLPGYPPRLRWLKRLVKRGDLAGVEIIQDNSDHLGFRVALIDKPFHLLGKITVRAPLAYFEAPPTGLRLAKDKQVARAVSVAKY